MFLFSYKTTVLLHFCLLYISDSNYVAILDDNFVYCILTVMTKKTYDVATCITSKIRINIFRAFRQFCLMSKAIQVAIYNWTFSISIFSSCINKSSYIMRPIVAMYETFSLTIPFVSV